jgi:cell wall-associated NlpC family hydrolase
VASQSTAQRASKKALAVATATVGSIALIPGLAQADPAPSVNDVKAKVDQLREEAEKATEAYDAATAQLADLQHKVDQLQARITAEQTQLGDAQSSLGSLAAAQYKSGGVDGTLQLMISNAPDSFLQQATALSEISARTTNAVRSSQELERQLKQDKAGAADQLAQLQKTRDAMAKAKAEADAKQKAAQSLLNSLTATQRQQYNQAVAKETSVDAGAVANLPNISADSRAGIAVAFARAQIGKPYISGAAGPNAYDCSGLTMAAWAKAGVKMSHGSVDQYYAFPKVSMKDIQPGDLVLYYTSMHHVGIYVGNGLIVHAPHSGTSVQYAKINLMPVTGIVRP